MGPNPMVVEAIGSILRWLLAMAAGYLVQHGVWTSANAETYVGAAALGLISIGWSLWQKYKSRLVLVTALSSGPSSESDIKAVVVEGVDVPPVTTPTHVVPQVVTK